MRHFRRAVGAAALAATLLGAPMALAADWQKFYEDAEKRFRAEDYSGAIIQLKNTLKDNGRFLPARILLGRVYLAMGEYESAELELRTARQLGADPNTVAVPLAKAYLRQSAWPKLAGEANHPGLSLRVRGEVLTVLGIGYLRQREDLKAENAFREASVLLPGAAEPLLARASLYYNRGELDESEHLVEIARGVDPDDPEVWKLTGDIERQRGELDKALAAFDEALKRNPRHLGARLGRLSTLLIQGQSEVVLAEIEPVRAEHDFNPEAEFIYGQALYESGQVEAAKKVVQAAEERLLGIAPEVTEQSPSLTLLAAVLAYSEGKYGKAEEKAANVLSRYSGHAGAKLIMAEVALKRGAPLTALDYLEPLERQLRHNRRFLLTYGRAMLLAHRYDQAARTLAPVLKSAPSPEVKVDLALAYTGLRDFNRAADLLEEALAEGSRRAGIVLSRMQMDSGGVEAAKRTLQQLVEQYPDDVDLLNLLGIAHVSARELDEAEQIFNRAAGLQPGLDAADINLAKIALQRRDPDEAKRRYEAILAVQPDHPLALGGLADLAEQRGDILSAVQMLEKVRANHRDARKEILRLLRLYIRQDDLERALLIGDELLVVFPEDYEVNKAVGQVELRMRRLDSAKRRFRRMARFAGFNPIELHDLSRLQVATADIEGARWSLSKAVGQDPPYVPAAVDLIKLLGSAGETDEAMALINRVARAKPGSGLANSLRGDLLMRMGSTEAALAEYDASFALTPNPQLVIKRYGAQLALGRPDEALDDLEAWASEHPEEVVVRQRLALAYLTGGRKEDAIREHEQLVTKFPQNPGLHNNLAWLYLDIGDARAIAHAEKAYALAPQDPDVLDTYGWLLFRTGATDRGLGLLRESVSRNSTNPTALFHLASVLAEQGRDGEARDLLDDALNAPRSFPEKEQARAMRSRLDE